MPKEYVYPTQQGIEGLIARSYDMRHADTREALNLCLQARELSLKIDYQSGFANSLLLIGLCEHILGAQEGVIEMVQQALSLFESLGDERGQGNAYNLLANIYERKSYFAEAIEYNLQSLAIRRRIGDRDGEAGSLNNIGIAYTKLAQFSEAFEYLHNSLEVAESIPSPSPASYALNNMAHIFVQIGDLNKAAEYYRRSLELNRGTNDLALESTVLAALGRTCAFLKDHEQAIKYLKRSLAITQQTGNLHDQGVTLSNMGMAYQENGQYLQAEEYLNMSLEIMKKTDARASQSETLCLLGKNYLRQGKLDEAITLLHEALKIAEDIGFNDQVRNAHNLLAEVYKAIGDFEQALNHYHIFHTIWQSFYSRDAERRIHAIIARSEIQKAKRDAEEQRSRSRKLSRALTEVKKSENEKTRMLRQLESQSTMLEQLAREDGLTGVSNRRWLDIQINQEFERAQRFNHPLSIAMLDVDNFKSVNDQFSHLIGDKVLQQVARILRSSCRMVDGVGRYGGEEFLIILVETSPEQSREICEKIITNIRAFPWKNIHPKLGKITLSIGLGNNARVQNSAEMIASADKQLYRAKQQGKDRICIQEE